MKQIKNNTATAGHSFIIWIIALFGLTGLGVLILTLTGVNPASDFSPAIILIAYTPSLAALCAVAIFYGRSGLYQLLKQMAQWRAGVHWYALALLGPMTLVLAGNLLYMVAGGTPQWSTFFDVGALSASIAPLIAGSLGEEIGWRGFAQPLLQKRYSTLWAAIIVGVLWATWHLWPAIAPGGLADLTAPDVIQTYVRLISTAIIYAWIYNSTRGSLLLVMLAHAGHNIAISLMPADSTVALIIAFLHLIVAAVVVRIAGANLNTAQK